MSDILKGDWLSSLGGPLYEAIDEPSPDPSDFDYAPYFGTAVARVKFQDSPPPVIKTNHTFAYEIKATSPTQTLVLTLYSGATILGQWTHVGESGVFERTFDGNDVTDYSDLELKMDAAA